MRTIAEWLWRAAMLAALAWVGLELHALRVEVQEPAPDQATASAQGDDEDTLAAVRDDLDEVKTKLNAIMAVMARAR
ncbi:MAG: hypothetical protein ABI702_22685 [Burkholderiales bacterium]